MRKSNIINLPNQWNRDTILEPRKQAINELYAKFLKKQSAVVVTGDSQSMQTNADYYRVQELKSYRIRGEN